MFRFHKRWGISLLDETISCWPRSTWSYLSWQKFQDNVNFKDINYYFHKKEICQVVASCQLVLYRTYSITSTSLFNHNTPFQSKSQESNDIFQPTHILRPHVMLLSTYIGALLLVYLSWWHNCYNVDKINE